MTLLTHKKYDDFIRKYNKMFAIKGYSKMNKQQKNDAIVEKIKTIGDKDTRKKIREEFISMATEPSKKSTKKPVKKSEPKNDSSKVGFYEINTSHKDYLDSDNATMEKIEKEKISGKWFDSNASGGAGLSGEMTLKQAQNIRKKFKLGKSMRRATPNDKTGKISYSDF